MRSHRRHTRIALVGTALVLSACGDQPIAPTLTPSLELSLSAADARKPTDDLSRGVAVALGDPSLRNQLRDAMRASPLTSHKLILQDYLATSGGTKLRAGIATALKTSTAEVDKLISGLPAMDVYLPFKEHRLSWKGGGELLVGATMDRAHTPVLHSFSTGGKQVALVRKDGTPKQPLLILNPSTSRSIRFQPQPNVPGQTVQDPSDGEESGSVTYTNTQDGTSTTLQIADILNKKAQIPQISYLIAVDDGGGGGGGGGGAVSTRDTTYVRAFEIYWVWDDEWGGHEVYFNGAFVRNGTTIMRAQYRRDGIEACDIRYAQGQCEAWQSRVPGVPLFVGDRLRGGFYDEYIQLAVWESNWWFDDPHGTTEYRANQMGAWHLMCYPLCTVETLFYPGVHAKVKLESTMHVP